MDRLDAQFMTGSTADRAALTLSVFYKRVASVVIPKRKRVSSRTQAVPVPEVGIVNLEGVP